MGICQSNYQSNNESLTTNINQIVSVECLNLQKHFSNCVDSRKKYKLMNYIPKHVNFIKNNRSGHLQQYNVVDQYMGDRIVLKIGWITNKTPLSNIVNISDLFWNCKVKMPRDILDKINALEQK